jgi:DNA-binding transcriptional LysR family regulator
MPDPSPTPGPRELPHLATFARAAERGSFTAAAADPGVSQAAVSQRIAALEKELRTALLDRRAGRIALTESGERLYELARRILDLHEEAGGASTSADRITRVGSDDALDDLKIAADIRRIHADAIHDQRDHPEPGRDDPQFVADRRPGLRERECGASRAGPAVDQGDDVMIEP